MPPTYPDTRPAASSAPPELIQAACGVADFIETHAPLFVLTGAGCSTASGIPDYRDDNGDWKHSKPVQYTDFVNCEHTRRRYWARSLSGWPRVARSRPNPAHMALAALERAGLVTMLCTQNVDTLHQKAGSTTVIDLHGRLDGVECLQCDARYSRTLIQERLLSLNPAFSVADAGAAPDGDAMLEGGFDDFTVAGCDHCGGTLKPSVVFFGENVPAARVARATRALEQSGGLLVVGSSLMLYSGYRFCRMAAQWARPAAAINRGRTRADAMLELKVAADCGRVLEEVERLLI
ncbi:MAG: NAD-dependent protein deacetylase [Gammaproteobacteria bacterium]|nr:NAD-dependent protein deacetylase [Gammaproteobacteria bacterium]